MTRVIWCTPSRGDEADLISAVTAAGCTVVRRCLEAADLLAASTIEPQARIVVDLAVPRLGADIVSSIEVTQPGRMVGLIDNDDAITAAHTLGIRTIIDMRDPAAREHLSAELDRDRHPRIDSHRGGEHFASSADSRAADPATDAARGRIVAVTGPPGAPGRTTVALGLAQSWAAGGERVCLIDADSIAPSLAATIGITEDTSGLLLAARYAEQGALDSRSLGSACRSLDANLWVLTGIGSPDRWTGVRPSMLERVWNTCRQHFDRIVIDAGMLVDSPEVDDAFVSASVRDAATIAALKASDATVVVTRPDALATLRLIHYLPLARKLCGDAPPHVVINRSGRGDKGAGKQVGDALLEAGMPSPIHVLRDDASVITCVQRGALLSEVASTAKFRRAVKNVAKAVAA